MKSVEENLTELMESNFVSDLYSASVAILEESDNPLHFNFFCMGIRELIRIIMDEIASVEDVAECEYCEFTPDDEEKPTKKSRLKFAILNELDPEFLSHEFISDVDDTCRKLNSSHGKLSKYVHLEEKRFNIPIKDVLSQKTQILSLFADFIECIVVSINMVRNDLENHFESQIIDRIVSDTVDAVDELATHHTIDEVYSDKVEIMAFDKHSIEIKGSGNLSIELQYGSNSDLRNGIGSTFSLSLPFEAMITGSPQDMTSLSLESFVVDTSSYYE